MATGSVATKRAQSLAHDKVLGNLSMSLIKIIDTFNFTVVGEVIRDEYDQQMEDQKRRAIIATEEMVRREEQTIHEAKLNEANKRYESEKEKLIEECKQHNEREITTQKEILKEQMEREFEGVKKEMIRVHSQQMDKKLYEAKLAAEQEKKAAIEKTREEEQKFSSELAAKMLVNFEEEKQQEKIKNEHEIEMLLKENTAKLQKQNNLEQTLLQHKLTKQYEDKIQAIKKEHEIEVTASQQVYYDLLMEHNSIKEELRKAIDEKDYWKKAHDDKKLEFSHFIDQFPGFKGDFLIK